MVISSTGLWIAALSTPDGVFILKRQRRLLFLCNCSLISFLIVFLGAALCEEKSEGNKSSNHRQEDVQQFDLGDALLVIARGEFSGLFPDSSLDAYSVAVTTNLPNVNVWCDVQLTRDRAGICLPCIRLENSFDIDIVYGNRHSTYIVNRV